MSRRNQNGRQKAHSELSKAARNFNAKITRLEKKYPEFADSLPERVSVKDIKARATTTRELNKEINALKRFTRRDNEIVGAAITTPDNFTYTTTKWQENELSIAVRNYNMKITKLEKLDPKKKSALPKRRSVKEIKEIATSGRDIAEWTRSLKRFTEAGAEELVPVPGNDYNMKTTKWQLNEMMERVKIVDRERQKRYDAIKDIEMTSRGQELGYTLEQAAEAIGMGSADRAAMEPMELFTPKMNRPSLDYRFENIMRESQEHYWSKREQIMKETYIRTLKENFSEKDIVEVTDAIQNMEFKDFYETFLSEGGHFEWVYPTNQDDYKANVTALHSMWNPKR